MTTAGAKTRKDLELALYRINKGKPRTIYGNRKLSISAVAEEAGVDPSTIHNRYPEIAENIRKLLGKKTRQQRDVSLQKLKNEKVKSREQRNEITSLKERMSKLISINATLMFENTHLSAIVDSENVTLLKQKKRPKNS